MEMTPEMQIKAAEIERRDIIIGSIANYRTDHIKNWVTSIEASGFTGEKRAICYNLSEEVIEFLENNGFHCHKCQLKESHIFVQRFFDQWNILNQLDSSNYRYVIATDTRDVIFQTNPSTWLEQNMEDKRILVSSECIRFADEDWGSKTLKACFGHLYGVFSKNIVYNAGTIAGEFKAMRDFFLNIYQFSVSANAQESDQPTLNILVNLEHIKPVVKFAEQRDGWCAQLGSSMDPKTIDKYKSKLLEPPPYINPDGIVLNMDGTPFTLVHQYDRITELSDIIDKRYGGVTLNLIAKDSDSGKLKASNDAKTDFTQYCSEKIYGFAKKYNLNFLIKIGKRIKRHM